MNTALLSVPPYNSTLAIAIIMTDSWLDCGSVDSAVILQQEC